MGQQPGVQQSFRRNMPKKLTKELSPQELAEQYFDLKCLRQYVEMAEASNQTIIDNKRRPCSSPGSLS